MISLKDHFLLLLQVKLNDAYWLLFGDNKGWLENLSFLANIGMAVAAAIATWFGIRQLSHSKKVANLQFSMDMIAQIASMREKIETLEDNTRTPTHDNLLNLLEAYSSFLKEKAVSGHAREAIVALLDTELPDLAAMEPFKTIIAESESHATRFIHIRNYLKKLKQKG